VSKASDDNKKQQVLGALFMESVEVIVGQVMKKDPADAKLVAGMQAMAALDLLCVIAGPEATVAFAHGCIAQIERTGRMIDELPDDFPKVWH
jgi:hypothetical protein